MSAVAFIITPQQTLLFSDGRSIYDNGSTQDDYKKIRKINARTAVASAGRWIGDLFNEIADSITAQEITDPKAMADYAAGIMKRELSDVDYESEDHPDGTCSTYFWVLGYKGLYPVHYLVDHRAGFAPEHIPQRTNMDVMSMIYGNFESGNNPFVPHFKEQLQECRYRDIPGAAEKAFIRMIEDYEHTGRVNKNIFQERIVPA